MSLISLTKNQRTEPQKDLPEGMTEAEAVARVSDSISAPEVASGTSIILVDDTIRSGGTMLVAAGALLEAGAGEIYGLSLAKDAKFTQGGLDLSKERWQ